MYRLFPRRFLPALLFLLLVIPLAGQDTKGVGILLLPPFLPPEAGLAPEFADQLERALIIALEDEGRVQVYGPDVAGIPVTGSLAAEADPAAAVRALIAAVQPWPEALPTARYLILVSFAGIKGSIASLRGTIIDLSTGRTVASSFRTASLDLAFPVQASTFATALIAPLLALDDSNLAPEISREGRTVSPRVVFRSSLEGMAVHDSTGRDFGIIENGRLDAPDTGVEKGRDIHLVLSKEGHYPASRSFTIKKEGQQIDLGTLTAVRDTRYGLVWHANYPIALGGRFEHYFNPDWQWWATGIDLVVQPYTLWSAEAGKEVLQLTWYPGLFGELGTYLLFDPDDMFRMTLSTRFGTTIGLSFIEHTKPSTDLWYVPFNWGLELNLGDFTIRQETYFKWYLGILPNRLFPTGGISGPPRFDLVLSYRLGGAE